MSSGKTLTGIWQVLKLSSYTSLVLQSGSICIFIMETDIGGNVIVPYIFSIGLLVTCEMACVIISPLMVI